MSQVSPLEFYLCVLKPVTVFSGRVNGTPADPYINITWDGGATGTASAVGTSGAPTAQNTIWFGSMAGGTERGVTRLRSWTPSDGSGTAGTLKIAETTDTGPNIADDDFITIKLEWRLWPKTPRIDAADINNIIFYEDYDIAFVDQTVNWFPVSAAGPPAVVFLTGGSAQVQFIGERSFAVAPGATLSSFLWTAHGSVEGTSTSQGTEASPVTFTWTAAGQYLVSLRVTDSNGKSHTNYTWVFAIDPASPTDVAYLDFDTINDTLDFEQGGGSASFTVHGLADVSQFPDEALVVHAVRGSVTTPTATWPNRGSNLFVGYIVGGSVSQDPIHNTTSFRAVTIDGLMKNLPIYPVRLEDNENPPNWTQAKDLTVDRLMTFLAHWRSTLSIMTSIRPLNDTAEVKAQDFGSSSLYNELKSLLDDAWGKVVADHQSVLWLVRDYQLMTTSERAAATTRKLLHKGLWVGGIEIEERPRWARPVRKVKQAGVYYAGGQAQPVPYFSEAPGNVQADFGNEQNKTGLILTTQADLNTRCGLQFAKENQKHPSIRIDFVNDGSFTIAHQELFPCPIAAADNNRGLSLDVNLIPRRIGRRYDHKGGFFIVSVTFTPTSTGAAGVTITMPAEPPAKTSGGTRPPYDPPPPPPVWSPPVVAVPGWAVAADLTKGVYWTANSGASWERRVSGLGGDQYQSRGLIWDPWWFTASRKNSYNPEEVILWDVGVGFIAKSEDAGKSWQNMTGFLGTPPNQEGDSPAPAATDLTYNKITGDIHELDKFICIAEWQNAAGDWRGWIVYTTTNGVTWTWEALNIVLEEWEISPDNADRSALSGGQIGTGIVLQDGSSFQLSPVEMVSPAGRWGLMLNIVAYHDDVVANGFNPGVYVCQTEGGTLVWDAGQSGGWIELRGARCAAGNCDGLTTDGQQNPSPPQDLDNQVSVYWEDNFDFGTMTFHVAALPTLCSANSGGRPLALDLGLKTGDNLYLTLWDNGTLRFQRRNADTMALLNSISFGSATSTEVNDKTYYIVPYTPAFFDVAGSDLYCYVFGRFNSGGVKHLYLTTDGGTNFSDIGDASWGASRVGAFFALSTSELYAVLNDSLTQSTLWYSANGGTTWTAVKTFPFPIEWEALSRHASGRLLLGHNAAGGNQALWLPTPYASETIIEATGPAGARLPGAGDGGTGIASIIWVL